SSRRRFSPTAKGAKKPICSCGSIRPRRTTPRKRQHLLRRPARTTRSCRKATLLRALNHKRPVIGSLVVFFGRISPNHGMDDEHDCPRDEQAVGNVEVRPGIEDAEPQLGPNKENPIADRMLKFRSQTGAIP